MNRIDHSILQGNYYPVKGMRNRLPRLVNSLLLIFMQLGTSPLPFNE